MTDHLRRIRHSCTLVLLLAALALPACSDSPTDPVDDGDPGGTGFVDTPDIPEPASPGGDVPSRSETLTRIEALDGNFRARLADVYGGWILVRVCGGDQQATDRRTEFASDMLGTSYQPLAVQLVGRTHDLVGPDGNPLKVALEFTDGIDCGGPFTVPGTETMQFESGPFDGDVHIRRDRHWELRPLEGGAGDYLLIYPNTSGEVATSYESGSERSRTSEFGRSITAEVGLEYGPLSASVSATLSETFSSSVSVSESTTETFTKSVTGKEGTIIQFMVWELVEEYSFTDADGEPISTGNFQIETGAMERRGVAIALQSTEFVQK